MEKYKTTFYNADTFQPYEVETEFNKNLIETVINAIESAYVLGPMLIHPDLSLDLPILERGPDGMKVTHRIKITKSN